MLFYHHTRHALYASRNDRRFWVRPDRAQAVAEGGPLPAEKRLKELCRLVSASASVRPGSDFAQLASRSLGCTSGNQGHHLYVGLVSNGHAAVSNGGCLSSEQHAERAYCTHRRRVCRTSYEQKSGTRPHRRHKRRRQLGKVTTRRVFFSLAIP